MEKLEKLILCGNFISSLAYMLYPCYELLPSCNHDISRYLIPEGTRSEVTYYGKPDKSFRFSDHWNWYTSSKKCDDETIIQCKSIDMPWTRRRAEPGKATKPIYGIQVAMYDATRGCYHHIYGEKFDRKTKTWTWDDSININKLAEDILHADPLYRFFLGGEQ